MKKAVCNRPVLPEQVDVKPREKDDRSVEEKIQAAYDQTFCYSFRLLDYLLSNKENFVISPFLSVSSLIGLFLGTSEECKEEVIKAIFDIEIKEEQRMILLEKMKHLILSLASNTSNITLKIPSYLFTCNDFKLRKEYTDEIFDYLGITYTNLDLSIEEGVEKVTEMIRNDTDKRVTGLLSKVEPQVNMLLADCIYFNGIWKYGFSEAYSSSFYDQEGERLEIPFFEAIGLFKLGFNAHLRLHVLEIPFANEAFKFMIFLPQKDIISRYNRKLSDIANQNRKYRNICDVLSKALDTTQLKEQLVKIYMPKFKIETDTYFSSILEKFGINKMFDKNAGAFRKVQKPLDDFSYFFQKLERNKDEKKIMNDSSLEAFKDRAGAEEELKSSSGKDEKSFRGIVKEAFDNSTEDYEIQDGEETMSVKIRSGLALEEIVQKCIFDMENIGDEFLKLEDVNKKMSYQPFRCSRPFIFAVLVNIEDRNFILQLGSFQKPDSSGSIYSN